MTTFGTPAPQWNDETLATVALERAVLVLDGDGFYRFHGGEPATHFFEESAGITQVVTSSSTPKKIAWTPSTDVVRIY